MGTSASAPLDTSLLSLPHHSHRLRQAQSVAKETRMGLENDPLLEDTETSMVKWAWAELSSSWLNLGLTAAIVYLLYKILFQKEQEAPSPPEPPKPPVKKQDMTLQQLKVYDGESEACDGSICVAVNGKIFDVSKGKRFYGPGGPYSGFAGRDASRGLATFSMEPVSDDYDDLSDLKPGELEQVQEWKLQFLEKYDLVGKLLKPGEESRSYSDESSEESDESAEILEKPEAEKK